MDTTILVVDDDDAVRRILRKVLESKPYRVVDSGHPHRACELFDANRETIDLLVTDIKMPQMSGQQVAAHVWASRPDLPVVFISGYTDQAYAQELHGPHSRFIEKPFSSEVLLERVAEMLATRATDV
jgi:two-component system cell cycle sensor histidine kinase/response regulator CckA